MSLCGVELLVESVRVYSWKIVWSNMVVELASALSLFLNSSRGVI